MLIIIIKILKNKHNYTQYYYIKKSIIFQAKNEENYQLFLLFLYKILTMKIINIKIENKLYVHIAQQDRATAS